MKKRERHKKRMHPLLKLGILVAIAGASVLFSMSNFFTIEEYVVEGNSYYSDEEILAMGNCEKGPNIFWDKKISDIKERLSNDTYMESVDIDIKLPGTVVINLVERKQIAAVVYGEEYVVIDSNGTALRKTSVQPKITVVKGLTLSKLNMGEAIEAEEKVRLKQTLELLNTAEKNNMFFKKIRVSKSQINAYVFDSLVCKGKSADMMEAIEKGELQNVIQTLMDKDIERGTINVSGDGYITFSPEID